MKNYFQTHSQRANLRLSQYRSIRQRSQSKFPGIALTTALAILALLLNQIFESHFFNPLLIAILLGILVKNLMGLSSVYQPGIKFALKRILKLAVVLLGLRLSLGEVLAIGPIGLGIVAISSVSTFYLTCWLGRWFSVNPKLTQLIAVGTSICGASAVVATNAVVDSSEEDMTYAIAVVTGFGTLAMLLYPLLPNLLHLTPEAFGIWCGASVHEVAQVIATAFQHGIVSGEVAMVTKLSRVLLLVPIVLSLGWSSKRAAQSQFQPGRLQVPIPWFVVLFLLLVLANSFQIFPALLQQSVLQFNQFLLCISLVAMGLETNLHRLRRIGPKPIYLAAFSWLFLAAMSLGLIMLSTTLG